MTGKTNTRRGLLKAGLRGVAAAGLVAIAGGLTVKRLLRRADFVADNTCSSDYVCGGCDRLPSCILPQATSLKEARRE